uniref:Uncharacterized protein n=1 Tax=Glossina austeni TaxID=7395 RepID=A0A1A9USL9_GLOAU
MSLTIFGIFVVPIKMVIAFIIAVMTIMEVKGNVGRSTVAKVVTKTIRSSGKACHVPENYTHSPINQATNQPTNQQKQNEKNKNQKHTNTYRISCLAAMPLKFTYLQSTHLHKSAYACACTITYIDTSWYGWPLLLSPSPPSSSSLSSLWLQVIFFLSLPPQFKFSNVACLRAITIVSNISCHREYRVQLSL